MNIHLPADPQVSPRTETSHTDLATPEHLVEWDKTQAPQLQVYSDVSTLTGQIRRSMLQTKTQCL